jgi:hypothetical protein
MQSHTASPACGHAASLHAPRRGARRVAAAARPATAPPAHRTRRSRALRCVAESANGADAGVAAPDGAPPTPRARIHAAPSRFLTPPRPVLPSPPVAYALSALRAAGDTALVPPPAVCAAMRAMEKAKLPAEGLSDALVGPAPATPRRWRLVFTSSSSDVKSDVGGGRYFPVTAVQSWDAAAGSIVNGVYIGHLAALQFSGPCRLTGKRLEFDFDTLCLKLLGGVARFKLKPAGYALPAKGTREAGALPFFLFAHADDDVVVARGRSGGVALWARAAPSWEITHGATPL